MVTIKEFGPCLPEAFHKPFCRNNLAYHLILFCFWVGGGLRIKANETLQGLFGNRAFSSANFANY